MNYKRAHNNTKQDPTKNHPSILKLHDTMKNNPKMTLSKSNDSFLTQMVFETKWFTVSRIQKASSREIKARSYQKFLF